MGNFKRSAMFLTAAIFTIHLAACGLLPQAVPVNHNIADDSSSYSPEIVREPDDSSQAMTVIPHLKVGGGADSEASSLSDSSSKAEKPTKAQLSAEAEYVKNAESPFVTKMISGSMLAYTPNSAAVKYLGRSQLSGDVLWCAQSGTGAEFTYHGRNLEVTLTTDSGYTQAPRVGVFINGERAIDEVIYGRTSFPLIKSEEDGDYTVRIVKLSEGSMSSMGIVSVDTGEDETIDPAPERTHRIEFIGDSICCGYGVDGGSYYTTETQDITKSYPQLTADALDADYSVFAISGYGVYSGYTSNGNRNGSAVLPPYYCFMGCGGGSYTGAARQQETGWDFSRFQPEAVVINLGTNDRYYCGTNADRRQEFVNAYVEFIKIVRQKNPDAELFLMLGTCSQDMWEPVKSAASAYTAATGDERIHCVLAESGGGAYSGADGHPNASSQSSMAGDLTAVMKNTLGW